MSNLLILNWKSMENRGIERLKPSSGYINTIWFAFSKVARLQLECAPVMCVCVCVCSHFNFISEEVG